VKQLLIDSKEDWCSRVESQYCSNSLQMLCICGEMCVRVCTIEYGDGGLNLKIVVVTLFGLDSMVLDQPSCD